LTAANVGPRPLARAIFFGGDTMPELQAQRVVHEYTQINEAPPEIVFPLLCPVRELDWIPDWRYRLIYSQSGVAENGCVFATPNDSGRETVWVVSEYNPGEFHIAFVWVRPEMVASQLHIKLTARETSKTSAHIRYAYTGLSSAGNEEVGRYDKKWFGDKMRKWEAAINHYLLTGSKLL
jgi:hypothetical protein